MQICLLFVKFIVIYDIYVFKQIVNELAVSMEKTVEERYGQPKYEGTTEAWDFMQRSVCTYIHICVHTA